MADNIDITPGAGRTVATDEVGGRHYQRVKLTGGAEGSENHASVRADGTQEVSLADVNAALYAILERSPARSPRNPAREACAFCWSLRRLTMTGVTTVTTVTTVSTVIESEPVERRGPIQRRAAEADWIAISGTTPSGKGSRKCLRLSLSNL